MSEIAKYHESNPDPQYVGCRNTGALEDGVVFPGFEPYLGHAGFIGRSSIVEAAGELFGLTPAEVTAALKDGTAAQKRALAKKDDKIQQLELELNHIKTRIYELVNEDEPVGVEIR